MASNDDDDDDVNVKLGGENVLPLENSTSNITLDLWFNGNAHNNLACPDH